ncbi:DUF6428 family protein [Wenyingzhuangia sp. IMCC45533]
MKLLDFKNQLTQLSTLSFELPNGELVPRHFHVTEVGKITKHFIDCGGVERKEEVVNFQLWEADDYDHRLHPEKLLNIIELSQNKLNISDLPIEVEYQGATIGKYGIEFKDSRFVLTNTLTACLAEDACGIPEKKPNIKISDIQNSCAPGSGCC